MYVLRNHDHQGEGILFLDVEERLEKENPEWQVNLVTVYIKILRAQPLTKERTVYMVHIPLNVQVVDLMVACEIKFNLRKPRLYYKGNEVDSGMSLNSSYTEESFLLKKMEAEEPTNFVNAKDEFENEKKREKKAFALKEVKTEGDGVFCLVEVNGVDMMTNNWDRTIYVEIVRKVPKANERTIYKVHMTENIGTTYMKFPKVLSLLGAFEEYFGIEASHLYFGSRNNLVEMNTSLEQAVTGASFIIIEKEARKPQKYISGKSKPL